MDENKENERMAEEKRTENGQMTTTEFGTIRLDDEVVAHAAVIAAASIDGVVDSFGAASEGFIGNVTDGALGMLGKKNAAKGVRVDYKNDGYNIVINIKVRYGFCIPDLASDIQRRVKRAVEEMTGAKVRAVDIFVQGIDFSNINEIGLGDQHA